MGNQPSDSGSDVSALPLDALIHILNFIPPIESIRTISQVCTHLNSVVAARDIWRDYCKKLFKYASTSPWEIVEKEAQRRLRTDDPKEYWKQREIGRRQLRKGQLELKYRLPCEGTIVRCSPMDDQNILAVGKLRHNYLFDWDGNTVATFSSESMKQAGVLMKENMCCQMSKDLIVTGDDDCVSVFDRQTLRQTENITSKGRLQVLDTHQWMFTKVFSLCFDHRELVFADGWGIQWRDMRALNTVTQEVEAKTCPTLAWRPGDHQYIYSCYFDTKKFGLASDSDAHRRLALADRRMDGVVFFFEDVFESWPAAIWYDGNRVLCSDSRTRAFAFDPQNGARIATMDCHSDWIVALRSDDDVIITAGNDHQLRMWDSKTYESLAVVGEPAVGTGLCWAQWDQEHLVTCSEESDCNVMIYKYT